MNCTSQISPWSPGGIFSDPPTQGVLDTLEMNLKTLAMLKPGIKLLATEEGKLCLEGAFRIISASELNESHLLWTIRNVAKVYLYANEIQRADLKSLAGRMLILTLTLDQHLDVVIKNYQSLETQLATNQALDTPLAEKIIEMAQKSLPPLYHEMEKFCTATFNVLSEEVKEIIKDHVQTITPESNIKEDYESSKTILTAPVLSRLEKNVLTIVNLKPEQLLYCTIDSELCLSPSAWFSSIPPLKEKDLDWTLANIVRVLLTSAFTKKDSEDASIIYLAGLIAGVYQSFLDGIKILSDTYSENTALSKSLIDSKRFYALQINQSLRFFLRTTVKKLQVKIKDLEEPEPKDLIKKE